MPKYLIGRHMPWWMGALHFHFWQRLSEKLMTLASMTVTFYCLQKEHMRKFLSGLSNLKRYLFKPLLGQKEVQPPPVLLL